MRNRQFQRQYSLWSKINKLSEQSIQIHLRPGRY